MKYVKIYGSASASAPSEPIQAAQIKAVRDAENLRRRGRRRHKREIACTAGPVSHLERGQSQGSDAVSDPLEAPEPANSPEEATTPLAHLADIQAEHSIRGAPRGACHRARGPELPAPRLGGPGQGWRRQGRARDEGLGAAGRQLVGHPQRRTGKSGRARNLLRKGGPESATWLGSLA
ncbi:hypothetical protein ISCGN_001653 [Ixodes scapularis]